MSDFLVSARKYRPKTFDRVIGQDAISLTLKSAIKQNQLAQSFLFCGPRGVGKTSLARILAKTVNCENIDAEINACDKCVSCKSFNENSSFNVHELDAASNNSVDDIRNLVDQVRFAPQVGKFNIYIIDEVHMLSQSAFNAFLKTLEEPPSHAKFILATTEKHKIIPTILSRCQIFDFKRVSNEDIVKNLKYVADNENVSVEDDALFLIAEKSDGAMRDSLSLFDRLVSVSDDKLLYNHVIDHLNILDYDYFFKITNQLILNDISSLIVTFDEIINNGFDGQNFINGLSDHLRNLLLCQDEQTVSLLSKNESLKQRYLDQAKKTEAKLLVRALKLTNECDLQYKLSNNKRLLVEICLMQVSSIGHEDDVKKKDKKFIVSNPLNNNKKVDVVNKDNKSHEDVNTYKSEKKIDETPNEQTVDKHEGVDDLENNIRAKTISILDSLNQEKNKNESLEKIIALRSDDFSQEMFYEKWKKMIESFKENEKSNLALALGINKPVLLDDFKIEIELSNSSQVELINQEKQDILIFLKNELNNDLIDLNTKVAELKKDNTPYTNSDKYKRMYEDNKYLAKLGQKLGLDPDY
ncbi:MAG: DNA polymerase III subunit gamma/tau [Flavobacteriales bacterium]|nr:DNA polymerase III subunit gamma/tau [Flavobacteriales bacterium]